jgi:hypothetical protein
LPFPPFPPTTPADLLDALPDYEFAFEGLTGPAENSLSTAEPGGGDSTTISESAAAAAAGSGSGTWAAYYRTRATSELNAHFGDLQYSIRDLEVRMYGYEYHGRTARY